MPRCTFPYNPKLQGMNIIPEGPVEIDFKMKDKKFLMIPVYFLLILFIVDKVFALDYFKTKFIQPGNAIFYHHRNVLAERIKKLKNNNYYDTTTSTFNKRMERTRRFCS